MKTADVVRNFEVAAEIARKYFHEFPAYSASPASLAIAIAAALRQREQEVAAECAQIADDHHLDSGLYIARYIRSRFQLKDSANG